MLAVVAAVVGDAPGSAVPYSRSFRVAPRDHLFLLQLSMAVLPYLRHFPADTRYLCTLYFSSVQPWVYPRHYGHSQTVPGRSLVQRSYPRRQTLVAGSLVIERSAED